MQPSAVVKEIEPSPVGRRENYFGAVAPASHHGLIWAVGRKGRIIRSEDHGRNWAIQSSPVSTVHLQDIDAWDGHSAVVVGDQRTVLVTYDAGVTWDLKKIPARVYGEQLLRVRVEEGTDRAWVAGAMGSVLLTEDRGATWRMMHPEEDLSWNGVTVASDGAVWVVGEFGRMSRSSDRGATWVEVAAGAQQSLMDLAFGARTVDGEADVRPGVAVGLAGTVLVTGNGGEDWAPVEGVTPYHIYDVAWDEERFVAVGDGGQLLASDPTGRRWKAGKLGRNNDFWYTKVIPLKAVPLGGLYLAAGANLGISQNGQWEPFVSISTEVGEEKEVPLASGGKVAVWASE